MRKRISRKYAAYYRIRGTRRWKRKHLDIQGSKDSIIRLYQTWLISMAFDKSIECSVRPVPRKKTS